MTRDDILSIAREAGFVLSSNATDEAMGRFARFAALVAAAEREACAKECDDLARLHREEYLDSSAWEWAECAAAIRARAAHAQNPL